jgi:ABC-type glycerol-3-phosphate transport system substrate-binding protein
MRIKWLAAPLLLALVLGACSGGDGPADSPDPAADPSDDGDDAPDPGDGEPVELTLALFGGFGLEPIVEEYMELNPHVTINLQLSEYGDHHDALTTSLAGGNQSVRYTPRPGFAGTEELTYTISDAGGNISSATATVNLLPGSRADDVVAFNIGFFDVINNQPITNVQAGSEFFARVTLKPRAASQPATSFSPIAPFWRDGRDLIQANGEPRHAASFSV